MAGAAIAVGSDEGATFWNPALLSLVERGRLGFSYIDLVPGVEARQSYLAYARAIKEGPTESPGLEFSEHAFGLIYGNVSLELSDGRRYTENSLFIGYSYSPEQFVSVGASMGLLFSSSDYEQFDAKGSTFSIGLRVALLEHLTFGAVGRNLFSQIMFDSGENVSLEKSLDFGLAYRLLDGVTLEGDLVGAYGGIARLIMGGEAVLFSDVLALRAGVASVRTGETRTIPYFGLGVHVHRVHIDYNTDFDAEEAFENRHRFTLAIKL
jgi:hypothetical protein